MRWTNEVRIDEFTYVVIHVVMVAVLSVVVGNR